MSSLEDIVKAYKDFLSTNYSKKISHKRAKSESFRAEAVLFSTLRSEGLAVSIHENPASGGADFLCRASQDSFIVEVTCLEAKTVTQNSGWKEGDVAGSYGLITHLLRSKASKKAPQLSCVSIPRLLAITTEHEGGGELLGIHAAESLLTSETKIQVPLQPSESSVRIVTDLKDSVFFHFSEDGSVEVCRQSISAILLVYIPRNENKATVAGVLHPQPIVKFPIHVLPTVPFARLCQWPPKDGRLEVEWIIAKPSVARFQY